jgi:diguanylate cyclase (GGDEF)-like protein
MGHPRVSAVLERYVPGSAVSSARLALAVAVSYFVADTILNKIALGDGWEIFWPLNGVTIALLIMWPRNKWPVLLASVAFGTGVGEYIDDNSLLSTLVERAFSVLEVALSAALLPPFVSLETWLPKRGLYRRFAAAVFFGPVVSGLLAASYFHWLESKPFLAYFNAWALADAMGIAAVLPLVLALRSTRLSEFPGAKQRLLVIGTLTMAIAIIGVIFVISRYPLIFVLYPLLMLVDWLLGLFGSSIALCCACVLAVFLTEHGFGPFADVAGLGMSRNLAVQLYLGFHLIGFLPISILFLEQRRMDKELRDSLARTSALASLDGLTGVANRRTFDSQLEEQWQIAVRDQTCVALLMIDADHFKEFNDRLGHQAGDACLRALASALSRRVSRPGDLVARFGGEEFVILLPDTPPEGARHVAETSRAAIYNLAIAHPPALDSFASQASAPPRRLTVSIGCAAVIPAPGAQFQQLIEMADQALYQAKRIGRNCVCVADPELHTWSPGGATKKLLARIEAYRLARR